MKYYAFLISIFLMSSLQASFFDGSEELIYLDEKEWELHTFQKLENNITVYSYMVDDDNVADPFELVTFCSTPVQPCFRVKDGFRGSKLFLRKEYGKSNVTSEILYETPDELISLFTVNTGEESLSLICCFFVISDIYYHVNYTTKETDSTEYLQEKWIPILLAFKP